MTENQDFPPSLEPLLDDMVRPHDSVSHGECPDHPDSPSFHTGYAVRVSFPTATRGEHIVPMQF